MREISFTRYEPGIVQDSLLSYWYAKMIADGELHQTTVALNLSDFLYYFRSPRQLIYPDSTLPFWFAAWFEPVFDGAFFGVWGDKAKRHTKAGLAAFEAAVEYGLSQWSILIGYTKQSNLLDEHRRLGYTLSGMLPKLWRGEDTWVLYMTRESFDNREARLIVRSDAWAAESLRA